MIAAGAVFSAPWGRYAVHRAEAAHVVLRDLGNPTAYVVVDRAKLAAEYSAAATPAPAPVAAAPKASPPPASTPPDWSPPRRAIAQAFTLGAPTPSGRAGVPVGDPYWMPCLRRFEGEPHAWFVTSSATVSVLCPACRGTEPDVAPRNPDPPPLEPAEAMHLRRVGAQVRARLTPAWWASLSADVSRGGGQAGSNPAPAHAVGGGHVRSGASPATGNVAEPHADPVGSPGSAPHRLAPSPAADQHAERECAECLRRPSQVAVLVLFVQEDTGLAYCAGCLEMPASLRERAARGSGAWSPSTEAGEERSDAKADLGAFDRPARRPRPHGAEPATRRELWQAISAEVER